MNSHLERIKAEEEAFRNGRGRRNRIPFLTILVVFGLLFFAKQVNSPRAAAGEPAPQQGEALQLSGTEDSYWNLRLISADAPIAADLSPTLGEIAGIAVDTRIVPNLRQLLRAAEADGIVLTPVSGYRTIAEQQTLWESYAAQLRAAGYEEAECAALTDDKLERAGESDYHTGLAICFAAPDDAGFESSEAGKWLQSHAAEYGFLLRYPADREEATGRAAEAGHYRFVGPETAAYMRELDLCLEEYRQQAFTQNTTPGEGQENER